MNVFDELITQTNVKGVYSVKPKPKAEAAKKEHAHPSQRGKVRVEEKPKAVGSLGEINDEGCNTHGDTRFVLEKRKQTAKVHDLSKMREHLIYGEILGKPKCRR